MKTEDIFQIINKHPGVTGFQIWTRMTEQSRVARWFGQDSFWTSLFGPNSGSIYVHLARLEAAKRITSEWGIATAARGGHRPRHYYVAREMEKS